MEELRKVLKALKDNKVPMDSIKSISLTWTSLSYDSVRPVIKIKLK